MNRYLLPLGVFILLLVFLGVGLNLNPHEVPSPLIGKPAPAFILPALDNPAATFAQKDMLGKVWLLNVWASWRRLSRRTSAAGGIQQNRRSADCWSGLQRRAGRWHALAARYG
jgi:hypothetical protein